VHACPTVHSAPCTTRYLGLTHGSVSHSRTPASRITVTPADVCGAIVFCDAITQAIANAIAWGKVGAVVAALALTYGVAMSIAFFVYVCRSRGQRIARWTNGRAPERADSTSSAAREQSSP
jgi:hypothetical protein